ncbi:MAG TPA: DUF2059 domain-containing protein [Anaeromyxobacteraceae bacterium]|nr:DUF2059 domain-containing protein [Anaeromyxobacteraceae bacterium]
MRLAVILAVTVVLTPSANRAAEGQQAKEDQAVALSRYVLSEEAWARMQADSAGQLQQYVESSIRQSGAQVPDGFAARFAGEYARMVSYQELIDLQAGLLAKYYSAAEMTELLAFYKTPLGQKVIRTMPEVSQDVSGQMLLMVQQRLPALMERLKGDLPASSPSGKSTPKEAPKKPAKKP